MIAKQIRESRLKRDWSQAELSRRARLNPTTISLIESGRLQPYESQIQKLADAFGVKPEDIGLDGSSQPAA